MILETLEVEAGQLERRTGWSIKPEGACKGNVCVPIPAGADGRFDVRAVAERLHMPLIHDEASRLWCLGPEALGRALTTAEAPELALPDWRGQEFRLSSLRGNKVLLVAWASW
jgi:hypothetical protein